jgi:hypothetical protein
VSWKNLLQTEGGYVQISTGSEKGRLVIDGDRTALIRLSITLLKYAIDAHPDKDHFKAEQNHWMTFFLLLEKGRRICSFKLMKRRQIK